MHYLDQSDERDINEIINNDPKYNMGDIIEILTDRELDEEDVVYYKVNMSPNGEKKAVRINNNSGGRRKTRKNKRKTNKRKTNKRKTNKRKRKTNKRKSHKKH